MIYNNNLNTVAFRNRYGHIVRQNHDIHSNPNGKNARDKKAEEVKAFRYTTLLPAGPNMSRAARLCFFFLLFSSAVVSKLSLMRMPFFLI
jgi:hypothetical protein